MSSLDCPRTGLVSTSETGICSRMAYSKKRRVITTHGIKPLSAANMPEQGKDI
jgi:hypothetical protein